MTLQEEITKEDEQYINDQENEYGPDDYPSGVDWDALAKGRKFFDGMRLYRRSSAQTDRINAMMRNGSTLKHAMYTIATT